MSSTVINNRVNFASVKNPMPYPDFLDVQLKSFKDFLQLDTPSELRKNDGLYKVFAENFQNCMLFKGDSKIYTTASTVDTAFTTISNFTIETNFAVNSLASNQILFRSYNNTARNTHWLLKLDDDLQGVTFSVNTGSNIFKDYSKVRRVQ